LRPLEVCPANAGQGSIFARHRTVLKAQWISSKREHHAGQSFYVPLPGFRCCLVGLPGTLIETSRNILKHSETFRTSIVLEPRCGSNLKLSETF
jgi:hypothetical protein